MGVLDLENDWPGKSISYWHTCATVKNEQPEWLSLGLRRAWRPPQVKKRADVHPTPFAVQGIDSLARSHPQQRTTNNEQQACNLLARHLYCHSLDLRRRQLVLFANSLDQPKAPMAHDPLPRQRGLSLLRP